MIKKLQKSTQQKCGLDVCLSTKSRCRWFYTANNNVVWTHACHQNAENRFPTRSHLSLPQKRPHLGAHLGPSWRLLGSSGPLLAPSWHHVGPSWRHLGPSWPHLGPILAHLGPSWRHLRLVLDHLGPSQGHLEPSWAHLLPQEEESWLSASSSSGGPSGLLWPLPLWPRGPDGPVWTRVVACMALKALMAVIVPYCPSGS